jgi:hypothetical protein
MPDNQIPEIMRLLLLDAKRERSADEEKVATRFVLGHATIAEYIAARRQERGR